MSRKKKHLATFMYILCFSTHQVHQIGGVIYQWLLRKYNEYIIAASKQLSADIYNHDVIHMALLKVFYSNCK